MPMHPYFHAPIHTAGLDPAMGGLGGLGMGMAGGQGSPGMLIHPGSPIPPQQMGPSFSLLPSQVYHEPSQVYHAPSQVYHEPHDMVLYNGSLITSVYCLFATASTHKNGLCAVMQL